MRATHARRIRAGIVAARMPEHLSLFWALFVRDELARAAYNRTMGRARLSADSGEASDAR